MLGSVAPAAGPPRVRRGPGCGGGSVGGCCRGVQAMTTVTDDRDHRRFVVMQDGATARLVYTVDDGRMYLQHTEVPEAFRGQGIGGRLVAAAVERAAADGLTVVPWCPYARSWLEQHPDAAATV